MAHRRPVGLVAPMLYDLAKNRRAYTRDFHDITVGDNALNLAPFGGGPSAFGFSAAPGYDLATGLGTPDVANLVRDLARGSNSDLPFGLFRGLGDVIRSHVRHHHFDPSR
jgi:hypothetical protein